MDARVKHRKLLQRRHLCSGFRQAAQSGTLQKVNATRPPAWRTKTTRSPNPRNPRPLVCRAILLLLCLIPSGLFAQAPPRFGFEKPEVSWSDAGGDAVYDLRIGKGQGTAHSGDWSEHVRLQANNGSYVHLKHPIQPAELIEELQPSVWIKANRPGIHLLARVVLPRTSDPQSNKPATLLLRGTLYSQIGQWQQLRISDLQGQLAREARVLQLRIGRSRTVDTTSAYVDALLLNVYGGPGLTELWIDDLELPGFIPRTATGSPEEAGEDSGPISPESLDVRLQGSVLHVNGHPVVIRAVWYRGEPLRFLKSLGFNTVVLDRPPHAALLHEVKETRIWLVCPPPPAARNGGNVASQAYDQVVAWNVGRGLSAAELPAVRQRVEQIRQTASARPLVCEASQAPRLYSRHVDLLLHDLRPLGTSLDLQAFRQRHQDQAAEARGMPFWSVIQADYSPQLVAQWQTLLGTNLARQVPPEEQLRLLTFLSLAAGSRGFLIDTQQRLDEQDAASIRRARAIELLNLELELLAPWIASGQLSGNLRTDTPEVTASMLSLRGSHLLMTVWQGPDAQLVTGQAAANNVTLAVPGVSPASSVYEVSPGGVRRVLHTRGSGGSRVVLQEFGLHSAALFTSDPRVLAALQKRLAGMQERASQLASSLAEQRWKDVNNWLNRLGSLQPPPARTPAWLGAARSHLESCRQARGRGDFPTAYASARRALRALRVVEDAAWHQAIGVLETKLTSPFAVTAATLPEHWQMMQRLRHVRWSENRLPGGRCEDLRQMQTAGWRQWNRTPRGVTANAAETSQDPHGGTAALQLSVQRDPSSKTQPELPPIPLAVSTPPLPVHPKQVVRVRGWVRIDPPLRDAADGLLIYDSITGQALALRLKQTKGWQPITLYRAIPHPGQFSVTFALTGLGQVWLDDITIETLGPPPQ